MEANPAMKVHRRIRLSQWMTSLSCVAVAGIWVATIAAQEKQSDDRSGGAAASVDEAKPSSEEEPASPVQPDAEDIIRQLREDRSPPMPILPVGRGEEGTGRARRTFDPVSPNAQLEPLLPEGGYLVDRTGRLVRSGKWWTFVMEGKSQVVRSRPIRILPSRLLVTMEQAAANAGGDVQFVVSGEITEYDGDNYVLLRKVLIQRGAGNLGGDRGT